MEHDTPPPVAAIVWPQHYRPDNTAVHVVNERTIAAPAERVWAWLVRAPLWPNWYDNASDLHMVGQPWCDLALGVRFNWQTFGVSITSEVQECVPHTRLAWNAQGFGVDAYHAWLIEPRAGGCRVLTEETQHGTGATLLNKLLPHRMSDGHDLWLKSLGIQALGGWPPAL